MNRSHKVIRGTVHIMKVIGVIHDIRQQHAKFDKCGKLDFPCSHAWMTGKGGFSKPKTFAIRCLDKPLRYWQLTAKERNKILAHRERRSFQTPEYANPNRDGGQRYSPKRRLPWNGSRDVYRKKIYNSLRWKIGPHDRILWSEE